MDLFNDVPLGFGMALVQNLDAMQYFSNLTEDEKQGIIGQTHDITSKQEMQSFVNGLVNNNGLS